MSILPVVSPPIPEGQPLFFAVSPLKLVVMSTVTFGFYEIYWFYKNWEFIRQRTGGNIKPFWRALFGILFCYSCFKEVKVVATSRGVSVPLSPGSLAAGWIIFALCSRLPDPYSLVCWLTPVFLVPIQNTINRLNAEVAPIHNPNSRFSVWNIAGAVIGGILFIIMIIGTFLPAE